MRYVNLGTAGVKVSRVCLGTNMLGGQVDEQRGVELVQTFLDAGGNFIDESDSYGGGKSEEIVGRALKGARRQQAIVATKVNSPMGPGPNDRGNSRRHIFDGVEGSLHRLQTDYIDLYILHRWDADTSIAESMHALDDLVHQGKVRYVGISNFTAWQVVETLWACQRYGLEPVRSVQVEYNFSNRGPESDILPVCVRHGLTMTPFWVLQAGVVTGKYHDGGSVAPDAKLASGPFGEALKRRFINEGTGGLIATLQHVGHEVNASTTAVTIAWALSKPAIGSVITGTSRPEQVKENCAAPDVRLSPEQVARIDAASAPVPAPPGYSAPSQRPAPAPAGRA